MPRYEYVEGKSSKFWEIALDGASFTTTFGRIGAEGKSSVKEFESEEKAQKAYDKLVEEKTKKGYELVGGKAKAAPKKAAPAKAAPKKGKPVFEDEGEVEAPKKAAPKKAAAKAAPKKAAPKKAATKSAKASGARYFEFVDEKSSKFWEITRAGTSFTTRFGKIGTQGQSSTKSFDTEEKVQKEYDKLVAEKTKKGYVES